MTDVWLRATVQWCTRLFTLLVLIGAARLGVVAYGRRSPRVVHTPALTDQPDAARQPPSMPFGLDALRNGLAPAIPSDLFRETTTGVAGGAARLPTRRQVYLVVHIRPDRSELVINGVLLGQTPYVGEVACQHGGSLTITVVPPTGMPKHFERSCDRHEIRIEE
jgi:hypothetical protein